MSRCLAVETFFRSPTRGGPGAWRAPGWDMSDENICEELAEENAELIRRKWREYFD